MDSRRRQLEQLQSAIKKKPRQTVGKGEGNPDASILMLFDAPTQNDVLRGNTYVNGSIQPIFNQACTQAKLKKSDFFFKYLIPEITDTNDMKKFIDFGKTARSAVITYKLLQDYFEELLEFIIVMKPNIIVTAGKISTYLLSGEKSTQKWRGSIIESTVIPNMKIMPLLSWKSCFPVYENRWYIYADFMKLAEEKITRKSTLPNVDILLRRSYSTTLAYLKECANAEMVAFDIEVNNLNTNNMQVSCISLAHSKDSVISIPFIIDGQKDYFTLEKEKVIWNKIAKILENPRIKKIIQNATFDASFLFRRYGIVVQNMEDTMLMSHCVMTGMPKDLGTITSLYSPFPYYKDDGKEAFKAGTKPDWMKLWRYNALDSIVLMWAYPKLLKDLERSGTLKTYNMQKKLLPILVFLAENGVLVDTKELGKARDEARKTMRELEKNFYALCGEQINYNSPKQLQKFFYETRKYRVIRNAAKRPTADKKALKRLANSGSEEASLLLKIKSLNTLISRYYEMHIDPDNRIRCSMNPAGTTSGRLASSKNIFGTGANLQNQPSKMKKFFIARPGHILFDIDLGQAENRVVAWLGKERTMMNAFTTGQDVHALTAALISGLSPEEVIEQNDDGYKAPIGSGDKTWRAWGKRANHGLNYGLGEKQFAAINEIPVSEARKVVQGYHSVYPGVHRFHNYVSTQLKQTRSLSNPLGRKRYFWKRKDAEMTEAYSFIPQSTVADIINQYGLIKIWENPEHFPGLTIVNQVHDSIVVEIDTDVGVQQAFRMIEKISIWLQTPITIHGNTLVIPADFSMGANNAVMIDSSLDIDDFTNAWERTLYG